jgi:hypothetical protein
LRPQSGARPLGQKRRERVGRQRNADEVALFLVAFLLAQKCFVLFGFHAFGDDGEFERPTERDDGVDDRLAFGAAADVAHE